MLLAGTGVARTDGTASKPRASIDRMEGMAVAESSGPGKESERGLMYGKDNRKLIQEDRLILR